MSDESHPNIEPRQELIEKPQEQHFAISHPEQMRQSWASWPMKSIDSRVRALKCIQKATHNLADQVNRTLAVQGVFVHEVELAGEEEGEIVQAVRSVLYCRDGSTVATCSKVVKNFLADLVRYLGAQWWEPALLLKVHQVQIGKGHRYFTLEFVGFEELQKADVTRTNKRGT